MLLKKENLNLLGDKIYILREFNKNVNLQYHALSYEIGSEQQNTT